MTIENLKNRGLYIIYIIAIALIIDFIVLKQFMGFGYARHYEQNNIERYPAPYVGFTGKPNERKYNNSGFLGPQLNNKDTTSVKIAFFGGSTGNYGNPNIAEALQKYLINKTEENVIVSNFSIVSSHHRQHLHAILEYLSNYEVDIVIFYGGFNETLHNGIYDPRPGYPYKFFIDSELSPLIYWLLKNSALLGEIDKKFGTISGIDRLRLIHKPYSGEWNEKIVNKYFETLALAKQMSQILSSRKFGKAEFIAFYQPFNVIEKIKPVHKSITEKISHHNYIYDVSMAYDSLDEPFTDLVHVKQYVREHMAKIIADSIYDNYLQDLD